jgi:hypothetical protein
MPQVVDALLRKHHNQFPAIAAPQIAGDYALAGTTARFAGGHSTVEF